MTSLSDLIPRIESGEGEDRELDGRIMFDLFAKPVSDRAYLWPEDHPSWSFAIRLNIDPFKARAKLDGETIAWPLGEGKWLLMNSLRVPRLTTSVDAVLGLIEMKLPGALWVLYQVIEEDGSRSYAATLTDGEDCYATSPARALLAAVCRAVENGDG